MNAAFSKTTVTAVTHVHSGVVTAFFDHLPGLVVQGKSDDDVRRKLGLAMKAYIKRLETMGTDFEVHSQTMS